MKLSIKPVRPATVDMRKGVATEYLLFACFRAGLKGNLKESQVIAKERCKMSWGQVNL